MEINKQPRIHVNVGAWLTYLLLGLLALLMVFPFYWMFIAGTMRIDQFIQYPPKLTPGNDLVANWIELNSILPVLSSFQNSLFVAITITILQVFFCSLGAFAFAKYRFPGRDKLFIILLATMMIPAPMGMIPSFVMMSKFHWIDSYKPLIIPGMVGAFGIFLLRQYIISAVPDELMYAARIDGCNDFQIYWLIVLPLLQSGLSALVILVFINSWNDYMGPLIYLRSVPKYTLMLLINGLASGNVGGRRIAVQLLASSVAVIPILIVFFTASGRFIAGLTAGALKD